MHRLAIVAVLLAATTATALAQETPDAGVPPADAGTPAPVPTTPTEEEDLGEIEAAIGADTAATTAAEPTPQSGAGAALRAALNPDLSFILDIAAGWFWPGDGEPMQTGEHDPTGNGFTLQALEMAVTKSVDPYFKFDAQIVFSEEGLDLEEAYATTMQLPYALQARAGRFLTKFGRINPTHPHQWDFVDQPFFIGKVFGAEGNAGAGAELSWLSPLPWFTDVIVSLNDSHGRSFLGEGAEGEEPPPIDEPTDLQATAIVEQFYELGPNWSLLTGLSYATAPNPLGTSTRTHVGGVDLYLKWRPITYASYQQVAIQTEWIARRRGAPGGGLVDVGGYAQVAWKYARRWQTGARWDYGSPARVDGDIVEDPLDPEWTDDRHRLTADWTFYPTEFSRLRAQGSVDLPAWADPIWAAFFSLEVSVGAHGAHVF